MHGSMQLLGMLQRTKWGTLIRHPHQGYASRFPKRPSRLCEDRVALDELFWMAVRDPGPAALGRDPSAAGPQHVTTWAPSAAAWQRRHPEKAARVASARWISPWSGSLQVSWIPLGAPSLDNHHLDAANRRDHRVSSGQMRARDRVERDITHAPVTLWFRFLDRLVCTGEWSMSPAPPLSMPRRRWNGDPLAALGIGGLLTNRPEQAADVDQPKAAGMAPVKPPVPVPGSTSRHFAYLYRTCLNPGAPLINGAARHQAPVQLDSSSVPASHASFDVRYRSGERMAHLSLPSSIISHR